MPFSGIAITDCIPFCGSTPDCCSPILRQTRRWISYFKLLSNIMNEYCIHNKSDASTRRCVLAVNMSHRIVYHCSCSFLCFGDVDSVRVAVSICDHGKWSVPFASISWILSTFAVWHCSKRCNYFASRHLINQWIQRDSFLYYDMDLLLFIELRFWISLCSMIGICVKGATLYDVYIYKDIPFPKQW